MAADALFRMGRGGPILVHCSAGVGRTGSPAHPSAHAPGTFCLALAALRCMASGAGGWDNIARCVLDMRQARRYMVQTVDQFRFCFAVVRYSAEELLRMHHVLFLPLSNFLLLCLPLS